MPIRIQRYIAILAVILFIAKVWAWYITHSVTILTDAMESVVNVITGFFGLYSIILSAKPRDANHPYGHGKVEFISAAIEGTLIIIAGIIIIYEGVIHLLHPRPLQKLDVGLWIILCTGVLNFAMGRYAVGMGIKNRSLVIESAGKHLLSDAYSTLAIIIGLVLMIFINAPWLDSAVALAFAAIIIITGYRVLRRSIAGIMDEVDVQQVKEVIALLQKTRPPHWIDMHNMRVIQYGETMHIDAHMTLPWYYQVRDAEIEIHKVENLVQQHFGNAVEVFTHIDGCMPYQCKLCAVSPCPVRQEAFTHQIPWTLENVWANEKHGKGET